MRCLVAPTRRGYFTLCTTLYQCGPTLGAKVCHQLLLYWISSWVSWQGMQVSSTGGDSSYSWVFIHALDHNLGKEWAINTTSSCEEVRVKGNTPGVILEHFIVLFLDDTQSPPPVRRWKSS